MLVRMQDRTQAGQVWEKEHGRSFPAAFLLKSAVLFAQADYQDLALGAFTKALKQEPQNVTVYIELGKFLANTGQPRMAEAIWEEGLKIEPANTELRELLPKL